MLPEAQPSDNRRAGAGPFRDDGAVDYELIDAGGAARLERFGVHVVDRPYPGALDAPRFPDRWPDADLRFDRETGWTGTGVDAVREGWSVEIDGLRMELRPTDAGQVGVYPEHATMLPWLRDQVAAREPTLSVLHLFASTGLLTLALARAGAAVVHVDSARPAIAWARQNANVNGLTERPIRWLQDDAFGFTSRELRRNRRYDGIVLDPPSYGHGGVGRAWRVEADLVPLLRACRRIVASDGFMLLTAHTEGYGPGDLRSTLAGALGHPAGTFEHGPLVIERDDGPRLKLGAFVRWDGRST